MNDSNAHTQRALPSGDWPVEDLEYLGHCPVCASIKRSLLYENLQDKIFFAAPGAWKMWRCADCGVGYLDPRPSTGSIGRAYANYYTHAEVQPKKTYLPRSNWIARMRQGMRNDYLKAQYGYSLRPTIWGGRFIARVYTLKAYIISCSIRHLPASTSDRSRLLDIGSGDGAFVRFARDVLGYEAEGLEFDQQAIEQSREKGGVIHHGTLPGSGLTPSTYDQITLSHVLEHLRDPVAALQEALALLRSGGRIWIQVPSLDGASNVTFGIHSRLLEPPRHLVMFGANTLKCLMEKIGFVRVERVPTHNPSRHIFLQSWAIANDYDPQSVDWNDLPESLQHQAHTTERIYSGISPSADTITLIGYKI